jgi:hypothetical protein
MNPPAPPTVTPREAQFTAQQPEPFNAFRAAAEFWPNNALPMLNNQGFDPYPIYGPQMPTNPQLAAQSWRGMGLPMPNNQSFDPYR